MFLFLLLFLIPLSASAQCTPATVADLTAAVAGDPDFSAIQAWALAHHFDPANPQNITRCALSPDVFFGSFPSRSLTRQPAWFTFDPAAPVHAELQYFKSPHIVIGVTPPTVTHGSVYLDGTIRRAWFLDLSGHRLPTTTTTLAAPSGIWRLLQPLDIVGDTGCQAAVTLYQQCLTARKTPVTTALRYINQIKQTAGCSTLDPLACINLGKSIADNRCPCCSLRDPACVTTGCRPGQCQGTVCNPSTPLSNCSLQETCVNGACFSNTTTSTVTTSSTTHPPCPAPPCLSCQQAPECCGCNYCCIGGTNNCLPYCVPGPCNCQP